MDANHSKSAFLHQQIRRALQSGRYAPGERIDPAMLAAEFHTSPTPVRFALYRLVGEGLIHDYARGGLYVPLPTELSLRDLYDWMERLLLMACDIGLAERPSGTMELRRSALHDDVVKLTWQLFDGIARATDHRSLHRAVKQTNDRLAPIRRAKKDLIDNSLEELVELHLYWQMHDIPSLRSALREYHQRRKQLVPQIVAMLSDGRQYLQ